jgi:hypothetical protein
MPPLDLDALLALEAKATKGPWEQLSYKHMAVDRGETPQVFRATSLSDEQLILAARNALRPLVEELRASRETNAKLNRRVQEMESKIASAEKIVRLMEQAKVERADGKPYNRIAANFRIAELEDAARAASEKECG